MYRQAKRTVGVALFIVAAFMTVNPVSATTSPKATITLSGDAVGSVRFGEVQGASVAALQKLIGKSEGGVRCAKSNCTIDAALYWMSFSVYFFHGKFVGYQTANYLTRGHESTFNEATP